MRLFGPYYYGKHKWDNYLLDIQGAIKSEETAIEQSGRLQKGALESLSEQQLSEMRQQTEQMRRIEGALQSGFEELRAEFEWGFTLMVDRMDTMIDHLTQLAAKLDAIHKTLQSPLLTQARELFQLGQEHFRKGLLDKALEAYLKAEEKNEVDFPLQLQIGKLYLYGRDEDDDVLDLPKAEKHLVLAARYADAEKAAFPQWNKYCAQAYFHAAVAVYVIGEQEETAGRVGERRACLERALGYLAKAAALWPRFTEIIYTQAKCHALLGQIEEAKHNLLSLSDRDRRYFEKVTRDGDFHSIQAEVEELFINATKYPGPLARSAEAKLGEVAKAITWAKRSTPLSSEDVDRIRVIERQLSGCKESLPTLEVDIEGLNERLIRIEQELEDLAQEGFQKNVEKSRQDVSSCELQKRNYESAIEQLKVTMKTTSGAGMGCLLSGLTFVVVLPMGFALLQMPVTPSAMFAGLVLAIVIGVVASLIRREHKNEPYRKQVEQTSRALQESLSALSILTSRADSWQKEMSAFAVWRLAQPSRSSVPFSDPHGTFTVTLISCGSNKINVIRAVRDVTGFDFGAAKNAVDNPPQTLKRGVSRQEADMIRNKLTNAGAIVQIG